jgi:prepilin-type processing-associated H-X9-DG protein
MNGNSGWGANATHNCNQASGLIISTFRCPSSPTPEFCRSPHNGTRVPIMDPSYYGIAGATNNSHALSWNTNSQEIANTACCSMSGAVRTKNGIMVSNAKYSFASVTDGSANTMLIGEISDYIFHQDGVTKLHRSPASHHGWMIGAPNGSIDQRDRLLNSVTIRFRINQRKGWGNDGTNGIGPNSPSNTPLVSAHPGGVNACFADGSVQFLSDGMIFEILARLTVRDEGLVATTN